jgi:hypothetical protein
MDFRILARILLDAFDDLVYWMVMVVSFPYRRLTRRKKMAVITDYGVGD